MKRFRCPNCGKVYTLRPENYFARNAASKETIIDRLISRINTGRWNKSPGLTRQRQGHWLRALQKNILKHLGLNFMGDLIGGLQELLQMGKNPILRTK